MNDQDPKEPENKYAAYLGLGIVLGISLGTVFGLLTDNPAIGISLGLVGSIFIVSAMVAFVAKNKK